MRLRYTINSPFARKVRIVTHELGLADAIVLVPTVVRTRDPDFWSDNPIGKVPVLVTDDGQKLADSNVICEFLDATYGDNQLLATTAPERWRHLTQIAWADAVLEAGILARHEKGRPADHQQNLRIEEEMAKVARGLDAIERAIAENARDANLFGLAAIAFASCLGWVELRFGAAYLFETRPQLADWWQLTCQRPSLQLTRPASDV